MSFNLGDIFTTIKVKSEGAKEAADGIANMTNKAQEGAGKLNKFADGFKDFAKVTGAALTVVGVGLTAYAKNANDFTVDYVKNSTQIARETGATVEQASRLTYVLGRVGIAAEDASTVFGIFSKKIQAATTDSDKNKAAVAGIQAQMEKTKFEIEATTKEIKLHGDKSGELGIKLRGLESDYQGLQVQLKDTGSAFDKLGIEVTDNTGKQKDFHSILLEVADRFKAMPDGVEKTALSMELFGRSGKDMIKVLNLGSQGIADLEKNADKLGLTLTQQNIGAVSAYIESQKQLKENSDAIKIAVGTLTAPVLTKFNNKISELTGSFQNLNPALKGAVASVLAFGGPIATASGGLLTFLGSYDQAKPALDGIIGKIPIVGTLFTALGALFTNPWVLVIIAVAAAVGLLLNHFGVLKPMVDALVSTLSILWSTLVSALKPAFDVIRDAMQQLAPYWPAIRQGLKLIAEVIGVVVIVAIVALASALAAAVAAFAYATAAVAQFVAFMTRSWSNMWYLITSGVIGFVNIVRAWFGNLPGVISGALQGMVNSIHGWIGTFFNSGKALFEAFGRGISSAVQSVKNSVNDGLARVRKLLPFSDAKEGPLSDLTLSGQRLMETIAQGVTKGTPQLYTQVSASLAVGAGPALGGSVPGASSSGGGSGDVTTNINGDIIIGSEVDADNFFKRLTRGQELAKRGIAAPAGSLG